MTYQQYIDQLEADLFKVREIAQHSSRELDKASEIIHELRAQGARDASLIERLRRKVEALTPVSARPTVSYGRTTETLRFADFAPLTYEQIMQRMYADAAALEHESEESLSQMIALFGEPEHELIQPIGRRPQRSGVKLPRPGSWSAAGLNQQSQK